MKKIFMVFALMAMLMLPFTSFSMTAMEEGDLSSVTGQAGVSINLDARVDLVAETVAWGDLDGFEAAEGAPPVTVAGNAGWVGLSALAIDNLRIRADQTLLRANFYKYQNANGQAYDAAGIVLYGSVVDFATAYLTHIAGTPGDAIAGLNPQDTASILGHAAAITAIGLGVELGAVNTAYTTLQGLQPAVVTDAQGGDVGAQALLLLAAEKGAGTFTPFAPLTIDIATGTAAVEYYGEGITFVRIGLGSLQVEMASMDANVELGPSTGFPTVTADTPELQYQLGSLYLGGLSLRIGGNSYVDIFNDRGVDAVTGKSIQGVSINTDVILKQFKIGTLSWGDADGVDWAFSTDTEGVYGLHTVDSNLQTIDAADPIADAAGYVGLKNLNIDWLEISGQIDIDVATDTDAVLGTDWTFVQIGLKALTIEMSGLTTTAALGPEKTLSVRNDNGTPLDLTDDTDTWQELGELYISNAVITVNGDVAIGARADGTQGVTLDLSDITVDISQGLTISWGDLDGIGGTSAAGYVGLVGLNIDTLGLQGKLTIDVATIDQTDPDDGTTIQDMMYLGYRENNLSPTIIHIGLGSGDATEDTYNNVAGEFIGDAIGVSITSLTGAVAFGPAQNLVGANTIGNLYLGAVKVGINGWLDIAAH